MLFFKEPRKTTIRGIKTIRQANTRIKYFKKVKSFAVKLLFSLLIASAAILLILLENKLLDYRYNHDYQKQHHSHSRGKSDLLELERRFCCLDNECAGAEASACDDKGNFVNADGALDRKYHL